MFFIGFLPKCPHFYGEPAASPIRKRRCARFLQAFNTSTSPAFMTQLVCRGCGEGVEGGGLIEAAGCWGRLGAGVGCTVFRVCRRRRQEREGELQRREKMTAFLKCVWGLVWSKGDQSGQPLNSALIRAELQWWYLPEP